MSPQLSTAPRRRPAASPPASRARPNPRPAPRREAPPAPRASERAATADFSVRRRIAMLCVGAVLAAVVIVAFAGGRATAGDEPVPLRPTATYVVRPGDSLWSIAARLAPDRDPRPVVAALKRAAGGTQLEPGQRILLPPMLYEDA